MSWLRYCTDVAHCRSTRLCTVFGCLLGWYTMYTLLGGMLPCNGIFPRAKFTLHPSLAFSYIGSITAWHSSSGRWPNFAAFSRGRHLYSAEAVTLVIGPHTGLCMKYLRNRWTDLHQIYTKDVFGPSLGRVWRSRSKVKVPGVKNGIFRPF